MSAPLDTSESPAAGGTVRRYAPTDRAWIAALLGGTAAIDAKGNHIEIVEDGDDKAFAVWLEPDGKDGTPILGPVITGPERRDMFYAALLAVIEALVAGGYRTGTATVAGERVVKMLQRDLGDVISVTPVGRNVKTGKPGHWQIDVVPAAQPSPSCGGSPRWLRGQPSRI